MSTSIARGSIDAKDPNNNIMRRGGGGIGRAGRVLVAAIASLTAASAIQACGSADDKPVCLTAECRGGGDGAVAPEAGTGGGTDAVSAETPDADAGLKDTAEAGGDAADAEVAAKKAFLNCKPVPSTAGFKGYVVADGKRSDYTAGSTVSDPKGVKIAALVDDAGVQCENPDKTTGVKIGLVDCAKIAPTPEDCAFYAATSATDGGKNTTLCTSSPASAQVSSALKGDCATVWKSGKQVLLAEAVLK